MTDSSPTRFQMWVLECLQLAAYPAERQLREVRDLGVGVDEIALQLDDLVNIAMAHVANDDLPTANLELLRSVLAKVDECDRTRPNFLSEAGLQLPEWAQVRQLAADVMSALQVSWDIDADVA